VTLHAVGGTVSWSVTGTSSSLISAGGGGTLASGGSASVTVTLSKDCTESGGGTVSFSPGAAASVSWTCAPPDGQGSPGGQ
jgi:hypothetical protein